MMSVPAGSMTMSPCRGDPGEAQKACGKIPALRGSFGVEAAERIFMRSPFLIEQRIPWADVDLAKIVYFPRYFSYFEMAELEWIRQQGLDYEKLLADLEIWMPRVAAHANFKAPARLSDLIAVEMRLDRIGTASFTLGFDALLLPERKPLADGYIVIATVTRQTFEPTPVPERLRGLLDELELRELPNRER